jgi:predicted 3-demethylubiquinone-9 3-methyltransferase (glyoxalase superfamily)
MNVPTQKIIPCLWFDGQAEEAVNFYTSIFKNSQIGNVTHYDQPSAEVSGMPEGSVLIAEFQLEGYKFVALNGGPHFRFTPAVSFFVSCETEAEIDALWRELSAGGEILMPLQNYPFSHKFGWFNDKFGLSWQLNLAASAQKIAPCLMFVGDQHGKAEAAVNLYASLFENSGIVKLEHYGAGQEETAGTVQHALFSLAGQHFMAMDSSLNHLFTFTEAISFQVNCTAQAEVDYFWEKLSAVPEAEQCGWLKDKYGVSWQIVPVALFELLKGPDPAKSERVTRAMLQMKKIDIKALEKIYEQE